MSDTHEIPDPPWINPPGFDTFMASLGDPIERKWVAFFANRAVGAILKDGVVPATTVDILFVARLASLAFRRRGELGSLLGGDLHALDDVF